MPVVEAHLAEYVNALIVKEAAPYIGYRFYRLCISTDEIHSRLFVGDVRPKSGTQTAFGHHEGVVDAFLKIHLHPEVGICLPQVPVPAHMRIECPYGHALAVQGHGGAAHRLSLGPVVEPDMLFGFYRRTAFHRAVSTYDLFGDFKIKFQVSIFYVGRALQEDCSRRDFQLVGLALGKDKFFKGDKRDAFLHIGIGGNHTGCHCLVSAGYGRLGVFGYVNMSRKFHVNLIYRLIDKLILNAALLRYQGCNLVGVSGYCGHAESDNTEE